MDRWSLRAGKRGSKWLLSSQSRISCPPSCKYITNYKVIVKFCKIFVLVFKRKRYTIFKKYIPYADKTQDTPTKIKELYVTAKTIRLLEEHVSVKLCDLELHNNFLSYDTKSTSQKRKKETGLHQNLKMCFKGYHRNTENTAHRMGENSCK